MLTENNIEINGVSFDTLAEAFAYVKATNTYNPIEVNRSITEYDVIDLTDGNYSLYLNNGVTVSLKKYIAVKGGAKLDISGEGTIKEETPTPYFAPIILMNVDNPDKIAYTKIGKDITLIGWAGLFYDGASTGLHAICCGTVIGKYGVYVNGNVKDGTLIFSGNAKADGDEAIGLWISGNIDVAVQDANISGNTGIKILADNIYMQDSNVKSTNSSSAYAVAVGQNTNHIDIENCNLIGKAVIEDTDIILSENEKTDEMYLVPGVYADKNDEGKFVVSTIDDMAIEIEEDTTNIWDDDYDY